MITLADLLAATGGQLHGAQTAETWPDFCHDSRLAAADQLFVALRTPTGDGHDHIHDAVARGCTGILCQHPVAQHPAVTTLLVPDAGDALRAWAAHILRLYTPLVIAITGSSGKTTAKELTADLLEQAFPGQVFRTRDSYNDRLGIPLALGRLRAAHRFAVIEVGADAYGEIAQLGALLQPQIAAITTINDAHLGVFGSVEGIAAEKRALWAALRPGGVAICNADDPHQAGPWPVHVQTLSHSQAGGGAVQMQALNAAGDRLEVRCDPSLAPGAAARFTLTTHLLGAHQQASLRTAVAIALLLAAPPEAIQAGVAAFHPLPGRLRPLPGRGDALLLDDSYSANPAATRAALRVLAAYAPPRIAILGQHSDLGPQAEQHLAELGPEVAASLDHLITVGSQARAIAAAAASAGLPASAIHHADTPAAAADLAQGLIGEQGAEGGDRENPQATLLIKGSREARLERAVAVLLADPDSAPALLARQNPAWQHLRLRNTLRPTWVEIDTVALADNLAAARARLQPGVRLIVVLKADAYGHGAATVARIAARAGAAMAAVACLPEAQALRRAGIDLPLLILGYTPPWQARAALELDLHLALYDLDVAAALDQAAAALGKTAAVHIKVDSGMGRLGLFPDQVPSFLRRLRQMPHVHASGLFTHLAAADMPADPYTGLQLQRFQALLAALEGEGLRPPLVHAANTAAFLTRPDAQFDAVRLGIGLYGLAPAPDLPLPPDFRPALSWKTTIAQVKTLPPGAPVGYGLSYHTIGEQRIAILPVGYADGFRRAPRNWGHVLVRGQRAPLVGRVSMDQAAIDVSAIPGVVPGDEVVLIGRQGEAHLSADEVAAWLGTINYEVISAILARVPRLPE